jgi:signal transduction histidine kinase
MWRRVRPPLVVVALALLGSIVLLAVLQYRWLGQISEAEREQRRATLARGASEFAQDFDREITRAYLLFQGEPPPGEAQDQLDDTQAAERFAALYDKWQSSSLFPRLLKEFFVYSQHDAEVSTLRRFDPDTRQLVSADWPASMKRWREHLLAGTWKEKTASAAGSGMIIRRIPPAVWEDVPALVVPVPMFFFGDSRPEIRMNASLRYTIIAIDREYVARELLPSLAERHFGRQGDESGAALNFKVAVLSKSRQGAVVFQSTPSFTPGLDSAADATTGLFQVRTQDFTPLASEVRRFTAFATATMTRRAPGRGAANSARSSSPDSRPLSILIHPGGSAPPKSSATVTSTHVTTTQSSPQWQLVVTHPLGSLEAAVNAQRRRNLAISSGVLGLLGASMGLLVLSTRRAQQLAKQQMEFVAAVSHELRTPLAVIRSAADNLADGVVHDEAKIRRYGELMRTEGRRLTDMVEQILELAGIQSGQRGFALRPVALEPLIRDIVSSSSSLLERAGLAVELQLSDDLPAVLGDEPALRRVFQNLIDNAIKYGAAGGWVRIAARKAGSDVSVSVADNGIGIEPAEQPRIFEPFFRAADVVAAQTQGAGLGLSLVQRIVLAHGGRVTVKSTPRAGSEFTVELPSTGEDPAGERAGVAPQQASATSGAEGVASSHFSKLAWPRLRDASAELAVALAKAAHPRSLSLGDPPTLFELRRGLAVALAKADCAPRSGRRR